MRIDNGTLVLAVDGAKMLILRNEGDAKYPVLATLAHEEAENPPSRAQGTDAPGRAFSSVDGRRSAVGETDWHQQAEDRFAERALAALEDAADAQEGGIVVIAPPRMLGELRKQYGNAIRRRLIGEIDKDVANRSSDDIARAIAAHKG